MKFSIKFLLALIVLGAAISNRIYVQKTVAQLDAERAKIEADFSDLTFRIEQADEYEALYEAAVKGEKRTLKKYQAAFDAHKNLPQQLSQLDLGDSSKFLITRIPLVDKGSLSHYTFRIFVPEGEQFEVVAEFSGDLHELSETPNDSRARLRAGENVVDLTFDFADPSRFKLILNDQMVFSNELVNKPTGVSSSIEVAVGSQVEKTDWVHPLELVEFAVGEPEFKVELRLKIQKGAVGE